MKAFSLIRQEPWYRRQAFESGLKRAGFEVLQRSPDGARPGDVLLLWNRYGGTHEIAVRFEREGGLVLVAENGYIGAGGTAPKFDVHPAGPKPQHYYALAEGWHNGRGRWPGGGPERFAALGVELKPWRTEGEHILVCPNRSFGVGEQLMHPDWAQRCVERLRKQTKRPVRIRAHPGNDAPRRPLSEDLKGCWAVVIWSSSCGVHALAEGIPVICEAPYWICKEATLPSAGVLEQLAAGPWERMGHSESRARAFERLAWAQWQISEISEGVPFAHLLPAAWKGEVPAGA